MEEYETTGRGVDDIATSLNGRAWFEDEPLGRGA